MPGAAMPLLVFAHAGSLIFRHAGGLLPCMPVHRLTLVFLGNMGGLVKPPEYTYDTAVFAITLVYAAALGVFYPKEILGIFQGI